MNMEQGVVCEIISYIFLQIFNGQWLLSLTQRKVLTKLLQLF